ncbi:MAG: histidine phosphatase family protein [Actinomycetota bacterium]
MSVALSVTIHLVRHGEVEDPKGIIYGRLPGYHLSERGRRQAEGAAERLAGSDVGALWASPLERAQETAEAIAARLDVEITTDERLVESDSSFVNFGRTLRTFARSLARSPRHWGKFTNPFRPSWGESFADIRTRMLAAIADAVGAADGREVVIVSHQTPVLVARLALARRRLPPWLAFTPCETGSVTSLALQEGKVVSASYSRPQA